MMRRSHSGHKTPNKRESSAGSKSRPCKPPTPESQPRSKVSDVLSDINTEEPHLLPKQRSRSTVSDRQPWGQLLNKHTSGENQSVFGKLDPLRTLHFLARELQTHMQTRLPEETSLQEIIKAMHSALKRIPPEVASTVQLQEAQPSRSKDFLEFQRLIEGSTVKLEASCKQLEVMCGQLRDEKVSLETRLQEERSGTLMLQRRIDDLEDRNRQLTENLSKKEEDVTELKREVNELKTKLTATSPDLQLTVTELKKSKLQLERDNQKLEHQLRLCAIEKEKYLAILAVRDRQIYEIRSEMTQLQESVNEQLVELHNFATSSIPMDFNERKQRIYKNIAEQKGATLSSIWSNDDEFKQDDLFKDNESEVRPSLVVRAVKTTLTTDSVTSNITSPLVNKHNGFIQSTQREETGVIQVVLQGGVRFSTLCLDHKRSVVLQRSIPETGVPRTEANQALRHLLSYWSLNLACSPANLGGYLSNKPIQVGRVC